MKKVLIISVLALVGIGTGALLSQSSSINHNNINEESSSTESKDLSSNNDEVSYSEEDKYNEEEYYIEEESYIEEDGTINLVEINSNAAFSALYDMLMYPEEYEGKNVKVSGKLVSYDNPVTGESTVACLVVDETGCCGQGVEFILSEDKKYPEDYPEIDSEIVVTGTYATYEQNGELYWHLINANLE